MNTINEYLKNKSTELRFRVEIIEKVNEIIFSCIQKRKGSRITQKELADKVGVKQSAIARMERQKAIPQLDTLIKIMYGLGLTLQVEEKDNQLDLDVNKYNNKIFSGIVSNKIDYWNGAKERMVAIKGC